MGLRTKLKEKKLLKCRKYTREKTGQPPGQGITAQRNILENFKLAPTFPTLAVSECQQGGPLYWEMQGGIWKL